MRLFESKSIYDNDLGRWIEVFLIDGKEVDRDLYFFELDREKNIEDNKLSRDENCCCDCEDCCEEDYKEGGFFKYLLSSYTSLIQEASECSDCVYEILEEFAESVLEYANEIDRNFVEDEGEYENEEIKIELGNGFVIKLIGR